MPATDKNGGDGEQVSESVLVSNAQNESVRLSAAQWTQATGPRGGLVFDIFATSEGVLFAFSPTGIYRLAANETVWMPVAVDVSTKTWLFPMAEHARVLYLVSNDAVLASTDDGETWNPFCSRPDGNAVGFVIASEAQKADFTMYLALQEKGVFRSTDAGEQWMLLDDGLMGRTISKMAAIGDTVFAGTDSGLYRLDSGVWERLLVNVSSSLYSLVVAEDNLYVGTGPDFRTLQQVESRHGEAALMYNRNSSLNKVFRSANLGVSWTEITPTDKSRPYNSTVGYKFVGYW